VGDFLMRKKRGIPSDLDRESRKLLRKGRKQLTIMIVPHSENKGVSFHVSLFSLVFFFIMLGSLLFGFFFFSANYTGKNRTMALQKKNLLDTEASLDVVLNEVTSLIKTAGFFEDALDKTLNTIQSDSNDTDLFLNSGGDLSSLLDFRETDENSFNEIVELQRLKASMESSVTSLQEINQIMDRQRYLLADVPNLWPVEGGGGHISALFGPDTHPFGGYWYIHKGLDIGGRSGLPLIATANGEVFETGNDKNGYGLYVIIRHKYGFYTLYGHMQRFFVKEGQVISQGERIGLMGNTGLSTGSHVHYEIRIGTDVVDPMSYLNIMEARVSSSSVR
jgi:murein DD-endopeptidase MepM/ murein hydrolase activator NlpD